MVSFILLLIEDLNIELYIVSRLIKFELFIYEIVTKGMVCKILHLQPNSYFFLQFQILFSDLLTQDPN